MIDHTKQIVFAGRVVSFAGPADEERDASGRWSKGGIGLSEASENGVEFETGKPVSFPYARNVGKTPNFGSRFQQDIEPAGRYMLHVPERFASPSQEKGQMSFRSPLVLNLTHEPANIYGPGSWKARLSKEFGGKKGKSLSKAVVKAGYDGIVTVTNPSETSEIVDLTHLVDGSFKPHQKYRESS